MSWRLCGCEADIAEGHVQLCTHCYQVLYCTATAEERRLDLVGLQSNQLGCLVAVIGSPGATSRSAQWKKSISKKLQERERPKATRYKVSSPNDIT